MKGSSGILWVFAFFSTVQSNPKESGYFDLDLEQLQQLRLQTSPNAVPRIGRRSDKDFPNIGNLKRGVPVFTFPLAFGEKGQPLAYGRNSGAMRELQPNLAGFPAHYKVPGTAEMVRLEMGGREDDPQEYQDYQDIDEKRSSPNDYNLPTWHPMIPKNKKSPPGFILPSWMVPKNKKSPPGFIVPSWRFGKRFSKKSAERNSDEPPMEYYWRNILRDPQGFRFRDSYSDPLVASRYKRGRNLMQELNSVPLLGKREEEKEVPQLAM